MVEDVYEALEAHTEEIRTFREDVEAFAYWLDQYEAAKQGETLFPADDIEEQIAAHYNAFPKQKSKARERMMDVFVLENRVRNARNQGMTYDDLPTDDDDLEALLREVEDVKETYYEAREVGAEARETVKEDCAETLIDDGWFEEERSLAEIAEQEGHSVTIYES